VLGAGDLSGIVLLVVNGLKADGEISRRGLHELPDLKLEFGGEGGEVMEGCWRC
jgi:hypothetical protein